MTRRGAKREPSDNCLVSEDQTKNEKTEKKKKKKKHKSKSKSKKNKKKKDSSSSSDWSAGDSGINYGSTERISLESDVWDTRSMELYDSDNPPDYPLSSYHKNSKPRYL